MSSFNHKCDLNVGQMSHDQAVELGESLASELRGTEYEHDRETGTLHMRARDPIHRYFEFPEYLQDLERDGMINEKGKIDADASAIFGLKEGEPLFKYLFLQDNDGTIRVLDRGAGRVDTKKDFASMKITRLRIIRTCLHL
jgi:hypothetical protein